MSCLCLFVHDHFLQRLIVSLFVHAENRKNLLSDAWRMNQVRVKSLTTHNDIYFDGHLATLENEL